MSRTLRRHYRALLAIGLPKGVAYLAACEYLGLQ